MKIYKMILVLILALIIAEGVFAQDSGGYKNNVTASAGILGVAASYERTLTPSWSAGGSIFYDWIFALSDFGVTAFGRFYPWQKAFYVQLGMGFGFVSHYEGGYFKGYPVKTTTTGFMISPKIGWKIALGRTGHWTLEPALALNVALGNTKIVCGGIETDSNRDFVKSWLDINDRGIIKAYPAARLGIGYSF
jgi:hypothetical protein